MATGFPSSLPPEPLRCSIRLPRPLWIGVAAAVLIVVVIGLQFGMPILQRAAAIRHLESIGGDVTTVPRDFIWLHRWINPRRRALWKRSKECIWPSRQPLMTI
jgi:hypothetical protein